MQWTARHVHTRSNALTTLIVKRMTPRLSFLSARRMAVATALTATAIATPLLSATVAHAATSGPITMPASVSGMATWATLKPTPQTTAAERTKVAKRDKDRADLVAKNVSAAYGNAPAAAAVYHDPGLLDQVLAIAVRKQSPGLYVTAPSADSLGLALPLTEVDTLGPVQCIVSNDVVMKGQPVPANVHHTRTCQRTDGHLTVTVEVTATDSALAHDPKAAAAVVNSLWTAIG